MYVCLAQRVVQGRREEVCENSQGDKKKQLLSSGRDEYAVETTRSLLYWQDLAAERKARQNG